MGVNGGMRIRRYYQLIFIFFGIVVVTLALTISRAYRIQKRVMASEEHRYRSQLIAMELFQSSENLTRMARSYAVTGDVSYRERYFAILDIRNGLRLRPHNYDITFWHRRGESASGGEEIALQELMRREGFSPEEFVLLRTAQQHSDHLSLIEQEAFGALEGRFPDTAGRWIRRGAPDRARALHLLHNDAYAEEKRLIMEPIRDFMTALDRRTKSELIREESRLRGYLILALALLAIALAGLVRTILYSSRKILAPVERLHRHVDELAQGNYASRCEPLSSNELGDLCEHFNTMAESLESDIRRRREAMTMLEKTGRETRHLLDTAGDGILGVDHLLRITFANPAAARMLGYAADALTGVSIETIIGESCDEPDSHKSSTIAAAVREQRSITVAGETFCRADNTRFIAEYRVYPQHDGAARYGAVITFNDITERRRAEEALNAERQRLAHILEGTNVGTWEWNVQSGETVFNERWAGIVGYSLAELQPVSINTWTALVHPDDQKRSADQLERHFRHETSHYECEVRMRHKDGTWVWVLDRGQVTMWTADGRPLLMAGTHTDITDRKKTEEMNRYLATHDALTGLPNLQLGRDRLAMALSRGRRNGMLTAVLFMDLDGFKQVNDSWGHDAGDVVLCETAERLFAAIRESDTVARIGGDEFLFIITDLRGADTAAHIAGKIIELVSRPITVGDHIATVGASIGIAIAPKDGDEIEEIIKAADEAMYRVKNAGKNGYAFAGERPAKG